MRTFHLCIVKANEIQQIPALYLVPFRNISRKQAKEDVGEGKARGHQASGFRAGTPGDYLWLPLEFVDDKSSSSLDLNMIFHWNKTYIHRDNLNKGSAHQTPIHPSIINSAQDAEIGEKLGHGG
jgi:hypothetical protein